MNILSRQVGRFPVDLIQPVFLLVLPPFASLQGRKGRVPREPYVYCLALFERFTIDAHVDSIPAGAIWRVGNLRRLIAMRGQQQSTREVTAGIGLLLKRVAYWVNLRVIGIPFGCVVKKLPGTPFPLPRKGGLGL